MKTETSTTDIRERIALHAYYLWLAGAPGDDVSHWLKAEAIEVELAERRASSAAKAPKTRRSKAAALMPAEALVAATAGKRRPTLNRATAH